MPLVQTRGAASAQGFGEFAQAAVAANYIEDVFSTYLYTGNGSTQTITNGIDLSTKGGLVWAKERSATGTYHQLRDTVRGGAFELYSNDTSAQGSSSAAYTFLSTGYSIGGNDDINLNTKTYASWTFREQPKFFDVVTFTTGATLSSNRSISHSLGSAPGFIIVKSSSNASNWLCYHRSLGQSSYVALQSTNAANTTSQWWTATAPTATTFNIDETLLLNTNRTYVAYLFAHDAGGFGLTGTDNVISCGSFTTDAVNGNASVNLGYEPQWLLVKTTAESGNWRIVDNMRGMTVGYSNAILSANLSNAESTGSFFAPSATGFEATGLGASVPCIYIAIRRGPMKVPTSGTSVFAPVTYAGNSAAQTITAGFRVDMELVGCRTGGQGWEQAFVDRLRGNGIVLSSASTAAEQNWSANLTNEFQSNTGTNRTDAYLNFSSLTFVDWMFQRAPSFFDEVCYTGTGSALTLNHNLAAVPELIILKYRSGTAYGWIGTSAGLTNPNQQYIRLNTSDPQLNFGANLIYNRTSTTFTVDLELAQSGWNWVGYLFATCAGVSKVGSYTGNGSTQTINCGFTGGARFVLIKKTSGTGDWMVSDSARGIVSGSDPYLELNNTNAEVTGEDWLDTDSTGFVVNEVSGSNANTNGATYIFLAIA